MEADTLLWAGGDQAGNRGAVGNTVEVATAGTTEGIEPGSDLTVKLWMVAVGA